jgi:hypothetical protein
MSNADGKPNEGDTCRAPSRRRTATRASATARRTRSRDTCPQRQRGCLPIFHSTCELLVAKSDDGRTQAQLSAIRALLSSGAATRRQCDAKNPKGGMTR